MFLSRHSGFTLAEIDQMALDEFQEWLKTLAKMLKEETTEMNKGIK